MTRNWTRRAAFGAGAALAMAATAAQALDLPFLGASDPTPAGEDEANTRYGRVRGETEGSLKVFRGVPYGAPTGGAARFMAPQPPRPWGGVRDTRKYGDQCPQRPGDPPPYAAGWRLLQKDFPFQHLVSLNSCAANRVALPSKNGTGQPRAHFVDANSRQRKPYIWSGFQAIFASNTTPNKGFSVCIASGDTNKNGEAIRFPVPFRSLIPARPGFRMRP